MPGFYDIEWENCYQWTLFQRLQQQLVINRWFYFCAEPYEGTLQAIDTELHALWVPLLQAVQRDSLTYERSIVQELFGDRLNFENVFAETGALLSGEVLPAFFGSRFRLIPFNNRVRKGRKIIAGITEDQVQGLDIQASFVDEHAAIALAMNDTVPVLGQDLLPSLLSPANTKHPGNIITQITSAIWSGWSTQSSRKQGRGA